MVISHPSCSTVRCSITQSLISITSSRGILIHEHSTLSRLGCAKAHEQSGVVFLVHSERSKHSLRIKIILDNHPFLHYIHMRHTPSLPTPLLLLQTDFFALLGNVDVVLPYIFERPAMMLVVQLSSFMMTYSVDRRKVSQGAIPVRGEDLERLGDLAS